MNREHLKKIAAEEATEEIRDGMILGLGTGSTAYYALLKIGQKVKNGLNIVGIPTSDGTEKIAVEQGIPLSSLSVYSTIDLTIDGADEVDANLNLIKGGGAALVREKIIANASQRILIIVDESKVSPIVGTSFALPVEIVKFGWEATQREVNKICMQSDIRGGIVNPLITVNGNYILDCQFDGIPKPEFVEQQLNSIPGVVENGLFVNRADKVIIGTSTGIRYMEKTQ